MQNRCSLATLNPKQGVKPSKSPNPLLFTLATAVFPHACVVPAANNQIANTCCHNPKGGSMNPNPITPFTLYELAILQLAIKHQLQTHNTNDNAAHDIPNLCYLSDLHGINTKLERLIGQTATATKENP